MNILPTVLKLPPLCVNVAVICINNTTVAAMYEYYSLHVITATAMCYFYHIVNIARPLLQCSYCCYHYGVLIAATVCNAVVSVNVIITVQRLTSCHCCGIKVIVTVWNTAAADTCKCCLSV